MREFLKEIEKRVLVHDGSKGYMLQKLGLKGGECGELWNITNPEAVKNIYKSYLDAGADVIQTNTFTANRVQLHKFTLDDKTYEINYMGAKLARETAGENKFVSASIGPTGLLFEPSGELNFDTAYEIYSEQVKAVADGGVDIINFETFTDLAELRAALLAAKAVCDLPVICSLAFENGGKTLMGTDPFIAVTVLKSLGADLAGTNCSFGPEHMVGIVEAMQEAEGGYISVKPNAGLPCVIDGNAKYVETPEHFAQLASEFIKYGARLIGGCCGTTPEFIKALREKVDKLEIIPASGNKAGDVITSNTRYIRVSELDWKNTGSFEAEKDKKLLDALNRNDLAFVEDTALDLSTEGYDAVYVNIDSVMEDVSLLSRVADRLQWYVKDPLIFEAGSPEALDSALRIYRGVAGVVIGKATLKNADAIRKVAARYGSVIIEKPANVL